VLLLHHSLPPLLYDYPSSVSLNGKKAASHVPFDAPIPKVVPLYETPKQIPIKVLTISTSAHDGYQSYGSPLLCHSFSRIEADHSMVIKQSELIKRKPV